MFLIYLQMRDEWNDLIECVVQKSLRNSQKRIRFNLETSPNSRNRPQDSACYLMDILPKEYLEEMNVESIDENHFNNIELLVVQLKDSGAYLIESNLFSNNSILHNFILLQDFRNNWIGSSLRYYQPVQLVWVPTPVTNSAIPSHP